MKLDFTSRITYHNIFIFLALLIGWTMTFLSFDYGPLEDNKIHQDHGVRILNYFKGVDKIAILSPVDEEGNYYDVNKDVDSEYHGMNGFGGFFDLLTNFLHQFFDSIGVYEFKNLINAIFGFLLFLFCGLLGKELGGWKTGVFTLLFVTLMPVIFGYSMNNPKDIPAAAFYMFSLFHIIKLLKELPNITIKRSFFLALNISLLINIRVLGLMVIGYVMLAVLSWWLLENYKSKFKNVNVEDTLILAGKTIGLCVLTYLSASIFWPYAHTNPITVPIEVLFKMGELRAFHNLQLFEGNWQSSFNVPWYYAIKNLFIIMMPLHAFIGFFAIPLLYYRNTNKNMLYVSMLLFASVFPMLLVIIGKPNSHDGSRQFMFSILPMVIASALSWMKLFEIIPRKNIVRLLFGGLVLIMLQPFYFMIKYHPLQALYFSPIVGGVSGAYGNYEIDYYGVGVRPALDWLEENVGDSVNPPKVRLYYGSQTKIKYYLDKTPNLTYALSRRNSPKWDYSIIMLAEGKYKQDHVNVNWSPEETVHEVKVDGIPICFVVKNNYKADNHIAILEDELAKNPSAGQYIELALLYYKKGNYVKSIEVLNKLVLLEPDNSLAYNNLCSAYNNLFMYELAKKSCEKSLALAPDFKLAKNNLKDSKEGLERQKNNTLSEKEYLTLSYNHYKLKDYKGCIAISKELLTIYPNNAVVYNNICSSYNVIGEHKKALEACEKALEISPDFQLAKNNLNWVKQELEK